MDPRLVLALVVAVNAVEVQRRALARKNESLRWAGESCRRAKDLDAARLETIGILKQDIADLIAAAESGDEARLARAVHRSRQIPGLPL